MNQVINILNLSKSYGKNIVLKDITFSVESGEIFALLGINGAGKTTTLECIEGIRKYDSGSVQLNGKLGVQLQSSSLAEHMKALEAIHLFAKWNKAKIDTECLQRIGIMEFENKEYRKLSTGQKRRLHLGIALLGSPDIIILDEPTAGLDVEGRVTMHEEIQRLKLEGKTILMASHDMAEVEKLCDKIAIIKDGKIVFCGTTAEITERMSTSSTIRIQTEIGEDVIIAENIAETLGKQLENYMKNKINVIDIKIEQKSLEEKFMEIAREE